MPELQPDLFRSSALPWGFVYEDDFLNEAEEAALLAEIEGLPLSEARYRIFTAKRRIVSFGAGYDFDARAPTAAPPIADFLQPLLRRAASWAQIDTAEVAQCTVAQYPPGTQLGWHRDVPNFGIVIGVSLASPCRMRLRRYPHEKHAREKSLWLTLSPRSIYVLRDEARWSWQHAISPTKALRYSITFRTMPGRSARG